MVVFTKSLLGLELISIVLDSLRKTLICFNFLAYYLFFKVLFISGMHSIWKVILCNYINMNQKMIMLRKVVIVLWIEMLGSRMIK